MMELMKQRGATREGGNPMSLKLINETPKPPGDAPAVWMQATSHQTRAHPSL